MNRFLVVGFGNTIRGDDGLGPLVAESLDAGQMPPGPRPRIVCLPQLDISLVAQLPEVDLAIFVDARQDDDAALLRVDRLAPQTASHNADSVGHSTHSMALSVLLNLARQWYEKTPACYLIQPKGFDFAFGESISKKAAIAATRAKQVIYQILWAHFQEGPFTDPS